MLGLMRCPIWAAVATPRKCPRSRDSTMATPNRADLRDWIQLAVIRRAKELDLTAYAIAKLTNGKVSEDHVKSYLEKRASMGSHKLQHVFRVLGLDVFVREDFKLEP